MPRAAITLSGPALLVWSLLLTVKAQDPVSIGVQYKRWQAFGENFRWTAETGESITRGRIKKRNEIGPSAQCNMSEAWGRTVAIRPVESDPGCHGKSAFRLDSEKSSGAFVGTTGMTGMSHPGID